MKRRTNPDPRGHVDGKAHSRAFIHAANILRASREPIKLNRNNKLGRSFRVKLHTTSGGSITITFHLHRGFTVSGSLFNTPRTRNHRDLANRLAIYRYQLLVFQENSINPLDFRSLTQLTAALSYTS